MDSTSYYSMLLEKMPNSSWKKGEIKEWLIKKGVQPCNDLLKAELYELAKKLPSNGKNYLIDTIAAEAGHTVVRLPAYHCQYNPIKLILAQVKSYLAKKSTFKMTELKLLVKEAMNNVTPQNWAETVKHGEWLQETDARQDIAVDSFLDSFVINITESSDDGFSD